MKVGVVGNPRYEHLTAMLQHLSREALSRGIVLYGEPRLDPFWEAPVPHLDDDELDALLTFGGDGTLLRGARLLNGRPVPILGVNVGRVGFLTTAGADGLVQVLDALVSNSFVIEPRLGLHASILLANDQRQSSYRALNEVSIHKGGVARVVRLNVFIDGDNVGPYSADGLIVATPTGSTAYSLSAGGPIVLPSVEAILVTPICAHTLAVRPLVVPATARVIVEPCTGWADDLLVSFDGQTGISLPAGATVEVVRSPEAIQLIRLAHDGFIGRMRQKLHWGDLSERERNG